MEEIAVYFIMVRVTNSQALKTLAKDCKTILEKYGARQKELLPTTEVVKITDPYTDEEEMQKPSFAVNDCLVTVRLWYNVFNGLAVSIIIAGEPEKAKKLNDELGIHCQLFFIEYKREDIRDEFNQDNAKFDCENVAQLLENYAYAELVTRDLKANKNAKS